MRPYALHWPTAMIRPKSQNFKIWHDSILSIRNFILRIKIIFYFFSYPVTDPYVLPISVATWNFLFIGTYNSDNSYQKCHQICSWVKFVEQN
jgi:hypothetical protein